MEKNILTLALVCSRRSLVWKC